MLTPKVLYRAHAKATGGRDGQATSPDGELNLKLTTPKELGGPGGAGTNPEQLFAAGYAACFIEAMKFVAARDKLHVPPTGSVNGDVGVGPIENGFAIDVELKISLPGRSRDDANTLVECARDATFQMKESGRGNRGSIQPFGMPLKN